MSISPSFAINHMATPSLNYADFIALADRLDCSGVEFRNDFPGVELFDGEPAANVKAAVAEKGLRILALSEVKRFNDWSDAKRDEARRMIETAVECGAEALALVPVNDADFLSDSEARARALRNALEELAPLLSEAGLIGFVEPLGFEISSVRTKREAVNAIMDVGVQDRFQLVHDTFHHFIAGETEFFPKITGIVHISGVVDPTVQPNEMRDGHRALVDAADRLGNVVQIGTLYRDGYRGCVSFEPFAKSIHKLSDPYAALMQSMDFIRTNLKTQET